MTTDEQKPQPETLKAEIERQGITITAEFVPWSKSRNFKAGAPVRDRNLNWKVTVKKDGRDVLTTDYMAGIAHAPSYPASMAHNLTVADAEALEHETEKGRSTKPGRALILPKVEDVLYSLAQDAGAIDARDFEDWASDFGLDTDSRQAEATYRACLEIALKLRAALGDAGLAALREATQDY